MSDDPKVNVSTGAQAPQAPERPPYSIVFIGDLGGGPDKLTAVDKDEFARVLAAAHPSVALSVKNPLGGDDLDFQISFDSLKAFEPAGILAKTPAARWRLGLRDKIFDRRAGAISPQDLETAFDAAAQADRTLAWIKQTAASTGAAAGAAPAGPSVLDMVDEPDESARVRADVERAAAQAGDPNAKISGAESGRMNAVQSRLESELAQLADAVGKHPELRRLETAWRSLKWIVDRIDFRAGVRLAAVHATRENGVDRMIEKVIEPAFEGDIPTPGLVVFDFGFTNNAQHYETLDYLAQHAASLPVPVTFPLEASFFDVKNLRLLKNLPNLSNLVDGFQYAKFRALGEQPYSKALAPVLGRFILRAPFEAKAKAREFTCKEKVEKISDLIWAGGHLALAVCAARAVAQKGWPTRMFGTESGRIEDLPVVDNPNDSQSPWGPGDLFMPDARIDELPAIGVNAVLSVKNHDYCMLVGGATMARPVLTQNINKQEALLQVSLAYQQFNNIVSAYICETQAQLRGLETSQVQERLIFGLTRLLGIRKPEEMDAVQVGVGPHPENPQQTVVQVRITPPPAILPGGLPVEFGFAV